MIKIKIKVDYIWWCSKKKVLRCLFGFHIWNNPCGGGKKCEICGIYKSKK